MTATPKTTGAPAVKVTRAPETIPLPQLKPTPKGTLEPRTVGRPVLRDLVLGVNLLVDAASVAESNVIGVKIFQHRDKTEQFHLAEVYVLGGPIGGDIGYLGSILLCRVDFPGGLYDEKYDGEVVRQVRELLLPGPGAYK